jgi:hypothetical protein
MTSSDYIRSLRVTAKDNFPDINYYNNKKAATVLCALNHQLRQQIIPAFNPTKLLVVSPE